MSFNNFIQKAIEGVPFVERFREYARETNWSNGEVVQRGTGGNYGEDGFLRPGFSYTDIVDYLYSKVIEHKETEQELDQILSRDWKIKIAAALVPRGMELNPTFVKALLLQWYNAVFEKVLREVQNDNRSHGAMLDVALRARKDAMEPAKFGYDEGWGELLDRVQVDSATKEIFLEQHRVVAIQLGRTCRQILDFAAEARLYNERVSTEFFNQPKPVDSVVDDFAVEAQSLANALTLAAALGAGTLAFRLIDRQGAGILSAIFGAVSILIAFATMTSMSFQFLTLVLTSSIPSSIPILPFLFPLRLQTCRGTKFVTRRPVWLTRTKNSPRRNWRFLQ